jgi:hypothetical protein
LNVARRDTSWSRSQGAKDERLRRVGVEGAEASLDWDCVRESECREYDFVDDGDDMFIVGYCVICRAIL